MSFIRVPGGVSEISPAEKTTTAAGEATVSASGDSNEGGGGGEEAKGAAAVGRKLSKVGLRKLKIW